MDIQKIRELVRKKRYRFSGHAMQRKSLRKIRDKEVEEAILSGNVIDEKLDDKPYPSCLIQGASKEGKLINSVIALNEKDELVIIITVYEFEADEWRKYLRRKEERGK